MGESSWLIMHFYVRVMLMFVRGLFDGDGARPLLHIKMPISKSPPELQ